MSIIIYVYGSYFCYKTVDEKIIPGTNNRFKLKRVLVIIKIELLR